MRWIKLKRILPTHVEDDVFNLTCTPTPNFFANNILVHNCAFCYPTVKAIFGPKVRYRSPRNVVEEIKTLLKYNKTVRFHDDSQTASKDWMIEFCNIILLEKVKFRWESKTRVNLIDDMLVKHMKLAGCVRFEFGVESGNDRVRNEILNKGVTREQITKAFKICHKYRVETLAFFMINNPTETPSEMKDTIQLMKDIKSDKVQVTLLTPLPKTKIYEFCMSHNLMNEQETYDFYSASIKNEHYSPKKLKVIRKALEKGMNGYSMWTDWRIMARQLSLRSPLSFIRPFYCLYYLIRLELLI